MDPDGVERRLAAVLHADVAGYSRLVAEYEDSTVRRLAAYRQEIELLIAQHRGRLVDFTGDELLAEFASAVAAVRAAVEIQSVLRARGERVPAEQRVRFRMGVHFGEVRVEQGRLIGTGVNVAARLQALAEPGGICISARVHGEVRASLDLECDDLGERELKNIPAPVRVLRVRIDGTAPAQEKRTWRRPLMAGLVLVLVLAAGLGTWRLLVPASTQESEPASGEAEGAPAIAVLPFDNLSGDPQQEYFADGLAEDLITRLSEILAHGDALAVGLPVIARNASFVYKGQRARLEDVSRDLRARYVVEGSVRRSDDRVRISVQLIDGPSGHHVWAQTYDRQLVDIFEIQDEITEAIAHSIGFELGRAEMDRAMRSASRELDAWETAHKATWFFQRMTREDMARSRELFRRVTELDPRWVWPHQALVMTHFFDVINQWSPSPRDSIAAAVEIAGRAAALDPLDPYGHLAMASAYQLTGKPGESLASLRRALELSPNMPLAHLFLCTSLVSVSPDEALAHCARLAELSPHDAYMYQAQSAVGAAHFNAGRFEEALRAAEKSLTLRRDWPDAHRVRAASLVKLGRLAEARESLAEAMRLQPRYSEDFARTFQSDGYVDALMRAGLPVKAASPSG